MNRGLLARVLLRQSNTVTKMQVGEERVYLAYTSVLLFIIKGSQGKDSNRAGTWRQELMQRPWRSAAHGLAFSACFLVVSRINNPGMEPPTMD